MEFIVRQANITEIAKAFDLLKAAAKTLAKKNIDQWQYWSNPPDEKVTWVKEGFLKQEFFFIENSHQEIMGMVRILEEDVLYWGAMNDSSYYVHSLIIHENFSGHQIGSRVLKYIEECAIEDNKTFLRLDCDATNIKLCEYYEKQGFLKVGTKQLPLSTYNLYQKKIS